DNNLIGPHVVIGSPGQDTRNPRYDSSLSKIKIGNNNIIREFTAIQKPCYKDLTEIGNDVFLMQSVHIPHDASVADKVVITPMCVIGGISTLLEGANIGMGASIHQYSIVGQYSIVATGSSVVKNVKPFSRYIPGKPITVNTYALNKFGLADHVDEVTQYVLDNVTPKSERIGNIVEHYTRLHVESGRDQY
ncbi:MAG TPA: hypothetical protein VN132_00125, partial [Bdellovibrio sp.]|nr:hypothetical protein [Bdellovibrio sp.]